VDGSSLFHDPSDGARRGFGDAAVATHFRPYPFDGVIEWPFLGCEQPWNVGYGFVSSAREGS
jgi:hypothetical protein